MKSDKQLASYESMGSLLLTVWVRSLLAVCTMCILACTVTAAPSEGESEYQLYKAYFLNLSKGEPGPGPPILSGKKVPFVDKTSFEEALKAGKPNMISSVLNLKLLVSQTDW